jgi:hypothetical protein
MSGKLSPKSRKPAVRLFDDISIRGKLTVIVAAEAEELLPF